MQNILAIVDDLFFRVKIIDAAKRAGMPVTFVKTEDEVFEKLKGGAALVIIDLNLASIQPVQLIERLKADSETSKISLLAYVSHVQGELKQEAHDAGCDVVLAKSAFSTNIQQILKRHSGKVA